MMDFTLRSAARSETGLVRGGNEDAGWAGQRLLIVADGMGGHVAGEVASSVAVASIAPLDGRVDTSADASDLADLLSAAISEAEDRIGAMVDADPELEGMGTTLTAFLIQGEWGALIHVGDSRAYRLRGNTFEQLTRDHTLVQELIEQGRLSPADAASHPQRSVMTQALMGRRDLSPDLTLHELHLGDRFLLCSDGLSGFVSQEQLRLGLAAENPTDAVNTLVAMAHGAGAPDNVTVVVADIVATPESAKPVPAVGSATSPPSRMPEFDPRLTLPRQRNFVPLFIVGALSALFLLLAAGWAWSQTQFFVAERDGRVAIYQGLAQPIGPIHLSSVYEESSIEISSLPLFEREQVDRAITARSLNDAQRIISRLRDRADACTAQRESGSLGPLDCGSP
jgi:PPM family protein phosphatase